MQTLMLRRKKKILAELLPLQKQSIFKIKNSISNLPSIEANICPSQEG